MLNAIDEVKRRRLSTSSELNPIRARRGLLIRLFQPGTTGCIAAEDKTASPWGLLNESDKQKARKPEGGIHA
jgi:hypothetical protein